MPGASIRDLMAKTASAPVAKAEESAKPEAAEFKEPKDISPEMFTEAWGRFIEAVDQPKLKAALSANTPVFNAEQGTVTQFVASELQRDWIVEKRLHALQGSLQKEMSCKVRLNIEVLEQPAEKVEERPYMPIEMAKEMMKKSGDVANAIREFDLEVS